MNIIHRGEYEGYIAAYKDFYSPKWLKSLMQLFRKVGLGFDRTYDEAIYTLDLLRQGFLNGSKVKTKSISYFKQPESLTEIIVERGSNLRSRLVTLKEKIQMAKENLVHKY